MHVAMIGANIHLPSGLSEMAKKLLKRKTNAESDNFLKTCMTFFLLVFFSSVCMFLPHLIKIRH